ncbi:MAG TPA: hypothetical protein VJ036_02115 [bacterium]|nr:hypothetical protein [bacterium]
MTTSTEIDELRLKLHRLAGEAEEFDGKKIPFSDLFSEDFMKTYTTFSSFEELLQAGNYIVDSAADFETIQGDRFDGYLRSTTKFNSWLEMLAGASKRWIRTKLF